MDISKQIDNEIDNLNQEFSILLLINKKDEIKDLDEIEIRGASLSLSALYNGIERILSDILKFNSISIGHRESWHKNVLDETFRNNVISKEIYDELKGFLSFRHFVRHAYSFEIEPETIAVIIKKAPSIIMQFIDEIRHYLKNNLNK